MTRRAPTKSTRLNVRVTPAEHALLVATAKELDLTLSDFIVAATMDEVERVRKDKPKPKT